MKRRIFVLNSALALIAVPAGIAQPTRPRVRIGYIGPGNDRTPLTEVFVKALRGFGYVEGQTLSIEFGWIGDDQTRYAHAARRLASIPVDVIVVTTPPAALAAKQVTQSIPIVMLAASDPVRLGLVQNLARPESNITGVTSDAAPEVTAKGLQILKELVPGASRRGVLENPANSALRPMRDHLRAAAPALGFTLTLLDAASVREIEGVLQSASTARLDGLIVLTDPVFYVHRRRIAAAASRAGLPAVYQLRAYAEDGGLVAYGPSLEDLWRRGAWYVDRLVKGAKPADLPVEQPTRHYLVVNRNAAKALGLTIPAAILLRADQVIE